MFWQFYDSSESEKKRLKAAVIVDKQHIITSRILDEDSTQLHLGWWRRWCGDGDDSVRCLLLVAEACHVPRRLRAIRMRKLHGRVALECPRNSLRKRQGRRCEAGGRDVALCCISSEGRVWSCNTCLLFCSVLALLLLLLMSRLSWYVFYVTIAIIH